MSIHIMRDGKLLAKVDNQFEVMAWIHRHCSYSLYHAVTYEGYKVIESENDE